MGLVLLTGSVLNASSITHSFDIPKDTLDWEQIVNVPMFNPTLGTLNSITFNVRANFSVEAKAENLAKTNKTASWDGTLNQILKREDGSTLIDLEPFKWNFSQVLSAYDKITDFGGISGLTHLESSTSSGSFVSTLQEDLNTFTGLGSINLTASSTENTVFTGSSGSMSLLVESEAGSEVMVSYGYTPAPIPEPMTILGLFSGVGALSLYTRRRIMVEMTK